MQSDRATAEKNVPAPLRGLVPLQQDETHDDKGYQRVSVYRDGVVFVRIAGDISSGAETNRITQYLRDAIARVPGKVTLFMDLGAFHHYQSDVRTRYTDAVLASTSKVVRIWIYSDSKLVRMGATVAGLALRQLRLLERAPFDAELARALQ
jgi:hypothetical protein